MNTSSGIRLNKYISSSGHCSRREADGLIETNRVKINGKKPELGARVEQGDTVTVDGMDIVASVEDKSDRVYIIYNKPVGITCTTEHNVRGNIVDAIDHDVRIFPVGRLDKPSEGIILLTNDGDIVNKILRAENAHSKEYLVTVNKSIGADFVKKMSQGIPILDTVTRPCKVSIQGRTAFKIILTQGLNRQIRRMCEYLGYDVITLKRTRIMSIELGRLKPGQWRNATADEMTQLNKQIQGSTGEASTPKKKKPTKKKIFKRAESENKSTESRVNRKNANQKKALSKSASVGARPKKTGAKQATSGNAKRDEKKEGKVYGANKSKRLPAKLSGKKSFSSTKKRKK